MAKDNSKNSFKVFQEFLSRFIGSDKNEERKRIINYIDLTYGCSPIRKDIESYLKERLLDKEWTIIGRLLVKRFSEEELDRNYINNDFIFDISTEDKFNLWREFIEKEGA